MKLQEFNFNGNILNVYLNENNEPLFLSREVSNILGYINSNDANRLLDEDEKLTRTLHVSGQNRSVTLITESGLYSLILRSNKQEAKVFKKWVTSEVLPSIRKHGAYMTDTTIENIASNPDLLIQLATNLKNEREAKEKAQQQIEIDKPKVLFAESLEVSDDTILIGQLSKLMSQNDIKIGQNRLFEWMRENGYLCKSGENKNMPTQKAMDLKLFEIKTTTITTAEKTIVNRTTKVTGKGQNYFINKFCSYKK